MAEPYEHVTVTTFPHPVLSTWIVGCDLPDYLYGADGPPPGPKLPGLTEWDTEEQARAAALLQARLLLHHHVTQSVAVLHNGNEILTLPESP